MTPPDVPEKTEGARCLSPNAAQCAREWERDHQREALAELGLADEFPFGCDAIEHVAQALVGQRAETARLRERVAALEDALLHATQRNHEPSLGCDGCIKVANLLDPSARRALRPPEEVK